MPRKWKFCYLSHTSLRKMFSKLLYGCECRRKAGFHLGVRIHEHLGEDFRDTSQLCGGQHATVAEVALQACNQINRGMQHSKHNTRFISSQTHYVQIFLWRLQNRTLKKFVNGCMYSLPIRPSFRSAQWVEAQFAIISEISWGKKYFIVKYM